MKPPVEADKKANNDRTNKMRRSFIRLASLLDAHEKINRLMGCGRVVRSVAADFVPNLLL
jgi:hypothetical protein